MAIIDHQSECGNHHHANSKRLRVVALTRRSVLAGALFTEALIRDHNVVGIVAESRITRLSGNWPRYIYNRLRDQGIRRLFRHLFKTIVARGMKTDCVEEVHARHPEVPYHEVKSINDPDAVEIIRSHAPDLIVIGATRISKKPILEIPPCGCINIHGAMLPRNAGVEPTFWALMKDEFDTIGVTIHYAVERVDAGDILQQERVPFTLGETADEIDERIMHHGAELASRAVDKIAAGGNNPIPLDMSEYTLNPRPNAKERRQLRKKIRLGRAAWSGHKPELHLWEPPR